MKHTDFNAFSTIIASFQGVATLFVYCFFGKMATESYKKMEECLYECNWHDLSPKHQKYFIIMIQNAQQPIHYSGFGIAVLNLETFTTVRNKLNWFLFLLTYLMKRISFADDTSSVLVLYDFQNINGDLMLDSGTFLSSAYKFDVFLFETI